MTAVLTAWYKRRSPSLNPRHHAWERIDAAQRFDLLAGEFVREGLGQDDQFNIGIGAQTRDPVVDRPSGMELSLPVQCLPGVPKLAALAT